MIFDNLKQIPQNNNLIIIGAGPAGITIALELEKKGVPSIIFEAGGLDPSDDSQEYYKGIIKGDEYPDLSISRLRQFGGTSGHWGGNCIELDEYDFSNWPIKKKELKKYQKISYQNLNIKGDFNKTTFNQDFDLFNLNWSDVRYKDSYYNRIKKSKKISFILNCPLLKFVGKEGKVKGAIFSNYGNKREINANFFVLATGGIENSRLLLWSREENTSLINKSLPIGNYWMDHPYHSVADGILFKDNFENYLKKKNLSKLINVNCNYSFYFSPKLNTITKNDLLNTSVNFSIFKSKKENKFIEQLKCIAPNFFKNKNTENYDLGINLLSEQEALFENKISLDNKKDKNEIPIPVLNWKRSEKVRNSSRKIVELIGNFLVENNLGRLAAEDFLYSNKNYKHQNGYHHMGGTRMGTSTKNSVVNKNFKVHDTKNLFISGSSVFVSSGHAYPTLTITQLSLKLADHLHKLLV